MPKLHRHVALNPGARKRSRWRLAGVLALTLLTAVSYAPAMLWGGFVWDDRVVTDAKVLRDAFGLWRIWFSPADLKLWEGHYWPLVYTSFWVERRLWGLNPAGYHLVNVVLHLVNALLLWRLLSRLEAPGAWLVAAVFAVHPVHVESVAWVIERKDLLSGLFYLTACLVWTRGGALPRLWSRDYSLSLGLFALGMLCKSIVVTLPVVLLLLHWQRGGAAAQAARRLLPFFGAALALALADLAFVRASEEIAFDFTLLERLLIAAQALWFYLGKLLWPVELAVIYPHWEVGAGNLAGWACVAGAAALGAALWGWRRPLGRGPLAGMLFFGATLLPVLGLVDYGYMRFSFVADRYQYLASAGALSVLIGLAARGMERWRAGLSGTGADGVLRWAATGLAAALLITLGALTWRQASIYQDDVTFFRHILSHNPTAQSAQYNLGNALLNAGRPQEALEAYRIAMEQDPPRADAYSNTGRAFMDLNRLEEAVKWLQQALELDPRHEVSWQNLALARIRQQRLEEALAIYQHLLSIAPGNVGAHSGLGVALHYLGRTEEALQSVDRALTLDPSYEEALNNRAAMQQSLQADPSGAATAPP